MSWTPFSTAAIDEAGAPASSWSPFSTSLRSPTATKGGFGRGSLGFDPSAIGSLGGGESASGVTCVAPEIPDPVSGGCSTPEYQAARQACVQAGNGWDESTHECISFSPDDGATGEGDDQGGTGSPEPTCTPPYQVWTATGECLDPAEFARRGALAVACSQSKGVFSATDLSCRYGEEPKGAPEPEKKSLWPWVIGLAAVGTAVAIGVYMTNNPSSSAPEGASVDGVEG